MSDLIDFLRARLDDDERVAREALNHPGEWNAAIMRVEQTGLDDGVWSVGQFPGDACHIEGIGITIYDEGGHNEAQAKHIAEHDPARELREVEAKRRILDLHAPYQLKAMPFRPAMLQCEHCADLCHSRSGLGCDEPIDAPWPCPSVRLLALPYSDHPDYREEWRP